MASREKKIRENKEKSKTDPIGHQYTFDAQYLADYVRLKALIRDVDGVVLAWTALEAEIKGGKLKRLSDPKDLDDRFGANSKGYTDYVRISRALEYYEGLCWFSSNHIVYAGLLTANEFYTGLELGYMPKDPGAGFAHGDYSHRLQWHAVTRVMTNGFTQAKRSGWNTTPLDLFTSLGSGIAKDRGLWGYLFDNQSDPFTDPDTVEHYIRTHATQFPLLEVNLKRRFDKRKSIQQAVQNYAPFQNLNKGKKPGDELPAVNVVAILIKWKKAGGAPFKLPLINVYLTGNCSPAEKIAAHFWKDFIGDHVDREKKFQLNPGSEGVFMPKVETPPTVSEVQSRVGQSKLGLNTSKYAYTTDKGAYPI